MRGRERGGGREGGRERVTYLLPYPPVIFKKIEFAGRVSLTYRPRCMAGYSLLTVFAGIYSLLLSAAL